MDVIFDWNLSNMIYNGLITFRLCGFPFAEIRSFQFLSFFPHFSTCVAGDIPDNVDVPPVAAQVHCGDGFHGSNSVEIINDSEPYEMARALDSDDDRPIGELTESDVEMMRRIFPVRRDPRVHEFTFQYVRIIKRNIKTIDNENNQIMKSSILCHITQHINTTTTCQQ